MSNATADDRGNNQSNDGEKSESLRGWIAILVSALLVCMTAALFVAGQSYRSAYMYELGFDLAQLPGDFHETLFWGFSGGTPLAVAWMIGGLIVTAISAALFWLSDAAWRYATNRWGAPADTIIRGYRLLCTESLCSIYDPDPKVRNIRVISLEGLREIRLTTRFDVDR